MTLRMENFCDKMYHVTLIITCELVWKEGENELRNGEVVKY